MLIDPDLFRPGAVSDETRAANLQLQTLMNAQPHITTLEPAAIRRARAAGLGIWGAVFVSNTAMERSIPGPAGDIRLRLFAEGSPNGVYLHSIYPGGVHAFDALPTTIARDARRKLAKRVRCRY